MSYSFEAHGGSTIRSELAPLLHHIGLKGAAVILVHIVLAQVIYRFCLDPLRHIPGPPAARFTELWRMASGYLGLARQVRSCRPHCAKRDQLCG
jgi:hypothetical protein